VTKSALRVLAVSAHPDDIEFGCAGTLIKWADAGAEVFLCIVTDGSTGTQDRSLMGPPLAEIRKAETEAAAEVIGAKELSWLGYRDGYVEYTLELRRDIARVFRRVRPHRFIVLDPTPTIEDRFINHPDHRAVGLASLDVSMTAGTTPGHFPELLEEGLDPWRGLLEVWIQGPGQKPVVSDITETIDRKIQALLCHRSQVGEEADEVGGWVREYSAAAGKSAGFDFAETFQLISQGPGFHSDEQLEEVEIDPVRAPLDPRSAPTR
jgi:LmbE family N-acetylglucosaminyl deacetylase